MLFTNCRGAWASRRSSTTWRRRATSSHRPAEGLLPCGRPGSGPDAARGGELSAPLQFMRLAPDERLPDMASSASSARRRRPPGRPAGDDGRRGARRPPEPGHHLRHRLYRMPAGDARMTIASTSPRGLRRVSAGPSLPYAGSRYRQLGRHRFRGRGPGPGRGGGPGARSPRRVSPTTASSASSRCRAGRAGAVFRDVCRLEPGAGLRDPGSWAAISLRSLHVVAPGFSPEVLAEVLGPLGGPASTPVQRAARAPAPWMRVLAAAPRWRPRCPGRLAGGPLAPRAPNPHQPGDRRAFSLPRGLSDPPTPTSPRRGREMRMSL